MIKPLSKYENIISNIKNARIDAFVKGDYKNWVNKQKQYAHYAIENYGVANKVPSKQVNGSVPLFSKHGIKYTSMLIRNVFRSKTTEEKIIKGAIKFDKFASDVDTFADLCKTSFMRNLSDNYERKMWKHIFKNRGI